MGYYDDDGQYHSFRRGVERAYDRVVHPFGGGHHHHHHHDGGRRTEVDVDVNVQGQSRGGGGGGQGQSDQIRYVSRGRGGGGAVVTIPCQFIRMGDIINLQGRPCEIIRISQSSQTGQYRFLGVDLFSKKLQEESSFDSNPSASVYVQSMTGPVFKQYRVIDISSSGQLTCMTETGDVKPGIPVIDNNGLYNNIERAFADGRGSIRVSVITSGGQEMIVDFRVRLSPYL